MVDIYFHILKVTAVLRHTQRTTLSGNSLTFFSHNLSLWFILLAGVTTNCLNCYEVREICADFCRLRLFLSATRWHLGCLRQEVEAFHGNRNLCLLIQSGLLHCFLFDWQRWVISTSDKERMGYLFAGYCTIKSLVVFLLSHARQTALFSFGDGLIRCGCNASQ